MGVDESGWGGTRYSLQTWIVKPGLPAMTVAVVGW